MRLQGRQGRGAWAVDAADAADATDAHPVAGRRGAVAMAVADAVLLAIAATLQPGVAANFAALLADSGARVRGCCAADRSRVFADGGHFAGQVVRVAAGFRAPVVGLWRRRRGGECCARALGSTSRPWSLRLHAPGSRHLQQAGSKPAAPVDFEEHFAE
eukprot:CAMPEP_0198519800 /NCGR_PEP_ID=MMETSP1462-20131121/19938_1 /TAXON_ID=1333877 /ORGANISM="Brandtodinium nutriculum, Strain RCC3387" /LENGTH=158 /DNA_ID=CAMNT_0044249417 /DNA_START=8 /DNA_END=484 /DNA_ORIENTATION=+